QRLKPPKQPSFHPVCSLQCLRGHSSDFDQTFLKDRSAQMAICIYCRQNARCTREHVIPSFLYDYVDRTAFPTLSSWNEASKSQIPVEHKVKDVCAECNNRHLSALDSYGKEFLSRNNLLRPIYETRLTLNYEYEPLARWLLKIAFNASRASGIVDPISAAYTAYMLTGESSPSAKRFFILVELLRPHLHDSISEELQPLVNERGESNPFLVRLTRTIFPEGLQERLSIDSVGFGGLFFHLAFIRNSVPSYEASQLKRRVLADNHWTLLLDRNAKQMKLQASHRNWIEMRIGQSYREQQLLSGDDDPFPLR
ncbi:MAG: hypothetical protein MRY60_01890, partial [Algiphilus sp.]|nr:hypothetical protein [Algiphilus sp.]